jgi:hypothetical protein
MRSAIESLNSIAIDSATVSFGCRGLKPSIASVEEEVSRRWFERLSLQAFKVETKKAPVVPLTGERSQQSSSTGNIWRSLAIPQLDIARMKQYDHGERSQDCGELGSFHMPLLRGSKSRQPGTGNVMRKPERSLKRSVPSADHSITPF